MNLCVKNIIDTIDRFIIGYFLMLVVPFLINVHKIGYLMYVILFIMKGEILPYKNSNYVVEYLYKNNIVNNFRNYKYLEYLTYSLLIIPFSYVGVFCIHYVWATLFLDLNILITLYYRYLETKWLVIFHFNKQNELLKIDNFPDFLGHNIVYSEDKSQLKENLLNIVVTGKICITYKDKVKCYENIYISDSDILSFEVIIDEN